MKVSNTVNDKGLNELWAFDREVKLMSGKFRVELAGDHRNPQPGELHNEMKFRGHSARQSS